MTSIMPRPFQSIEWRLQGLRTAVAEANGQAKIPQSSTDQFKSFADSLKSGGESIRDAMKREIAFLDGRTFPWSIEPATVTPNGPAEKFLLSCASRLQTDYRNLGNALGAARGDRKITGDEAQQLDTLLQALEVGVKTLISGAQSLGESRRQNRPAYEIFNVTKNSVNDPANDTQRGPFGLLTTFNKSEAESFIGRLEFETNNDYAKMKEVVELLYDTASSPFGDLVINKGAADEFAAKLGGYAPDLDWSKAINVSKEDHPIVALYAVAIDDVLNDPTRNANVRELEAMLRAGDAARTELSVGFVRNGPQVLSAPSSDGAIALSLAAAGSSRRDRAVHVEELGSALDRLRARVAELRA